MTSIKKSRKAVRFIKVGFILLSLFALICVFVTAMTKELSYDAAFNLQIAKSLASDLVYSSTYNPGYIHDYRVTTNGLLQYLCALLLSVFGNRLGLALTLTLVAAAFFYAAKKYSPAAWLLCITIVFTSANFSDQLTSFMGEITSMVFVILGLHTLSNRTAARSDTAAIVMAGVFFGFATTTKLISGVVVPFLAFGACATHDPKLTWPNFKSTTVRAIQVSIIALAVFVAEFYFSTFISQLMVKFAHAGSAEIPPSAPGLWKFIEHHFWQGSTSPKEMMLHLGSFSNAVTLPLIFIAIGLLLSFSLFWSPLVLLIACLLISGMYERRAIPIFFPLMLAGAWVASKKLEEMKERNGKFSISGGLPVLYIAAILFLVVPQLFQKDIRKALALNPDEVSQLLALNRSDFQIFPADQRVLSMASIIKAAPEKVLTSGWWQFPEYQLASGKHFYDRTAPEPVALLQGKPDLLLLFDKSSAWYPETSMELCSSVVKEIENLVLCRFKPGTRLNIRSGAEKS